MSQAVVLANYAYSLWLMQLESMYLVNSLKSLVLISMATYTVL